MQLRAPNWLAALWKAGEIFLSEVKGSLDEAKRVLKDAANEVKSGAKVVLKAFKNEAGEAWDAAKKAGQGLNHVIHDMNPVHWHI